MMDQDHPPNVNGGQDFNAQYAAMYGQYGGKATPNQQQQTGSNNNNNSSANNNNNNNSSTSSSSNQQQLPVLNQLLQSPSPVGGPGSRMPSYPPQQYRPQMGSYDQQPRRMMAPGGVPPGYPGGYPQGPPQGYQMPGYPGQMAPDQQAYSTGAYQQGQQQQAQQPRYPPQPNGPYDQMYNQYGQMAPQQPRGAYPDQGVRAPYYPPYQQQPNYGMSGQQQSYPPPGPPGPHPSAYPGGTGTPSSSKHDESGGPGQQGDGGMMSPPDGSSASSNNNSSTNNNNNSSSSNDQPSQPPFPPYMTAQQQQQFMMQQQQMHQFYGQQPPQQRYPAPQPGGFGPQYQQRPGGYGSGYDLMAQQRALYEQQQAQQQQASSNYPGIDGQANGDAYPGPYPGQQQRVPPPGSQQPPRAMLPPLPQSPGVASPYQGVRGPQPQQASFSDSNSNSVTTSILAAELSCDDDVMITTATNSENSTRSHLLDVVEGGGDKLIDNEEMSQQPGASSQQQSQQLPPSMMAPPSQGSGGPSQQPGGGPGQLMPPRPQTPGQQQAPGGPQAQAGPTPQQRMPFQPPSLSQSFYSQQPFQAQAQQQQPHSSDMKESLAESSDHPSFSTKQQALSNSDFPSPPNSRSQQPPAFPSQPQFTVNRQQYGQGQTQSQTSSMSMDTEDDSIRRPQLLPAPPLSPSSVASPISCPDESGDGPLSPTSSTKLGSTFSGDLPSSASKKGPKKSSSSATNNKDRGEPEEKEKPVYPAPPCPPGLTPCMMGPLTQPVEPFERLFELGDEPDRRPFLESLYSYYTNELKIFLFVPIVCKQLLDLFKMYQVVKDRGGFWEVNNEKKWKEIAAYTIANTSASTGYTLRRHYIKCLLAFELFTDRGHPEPRQGVADAERQFQNANKKEKRRKENKESKKAAEAEKAAQDLKMKQQQQQEMMGGLPKQEPQQPPQSQQGPPPFGGMMGGPGQPHPPGMMPGQPHPGMMFPGQGPQQGGPGGQPGGYPGMPGQQPGQFPGPYGGPHQAPPGYGPPQMAPNFQGQLGPGAGGYPTPPRPPGFGGPPGMGPSGQHPGQPGQPGGQFYPQQQQQPGAPQQQGQMVVGYDQFGRPLFMPQQQQGPPMGGGYPNQPQQQGPGPEPSTGGGPPGGMMGQRYGMHHQQQQMQQQQNHPQPGGSGYPPGYPGSQPQQTQQQQQPDGSQPGDQQGYTPTQTPQMMGGPPRPGAYPGMHPQQQAGMYGGHPPGPGNQPPQFAPHQMMPPQQRPPQQFAPQQQTPQGDYMSQHPPGGQMGGQPGQPQMFMNQPSRQPMGMSSMVGVGAGQQAGGPPPQSGPDFQHQQQPQQGPPGMMGGGSGSGSLTPAPQSQTPLSTGPPGSGSKPPGSSPHGKGKRKGPRGNNNANNNMGMDPSMGNEPGSLGMVLGDHIGTPGGVDSPVINTPPRKGKGKKRDLSSASALSASSSNASMTTASNTPSTPSNQLSTLLSGPPQNQLPPGLQPGPSTVGGLGTTGALLASMMPAPGSMLPSTIATVAVSPFPVGSVEAIQPFTVKRRKMTARDLGQVDPWRVVMSLKTSLVADQNWALDVLNVLLADDAAAGFFTLGCWPSLLEMLCEIFRSSLALMCEPLSDLVQNWEKISDCKVMKDEPEKVDLEAFSSCEDEAQKNSPTPLQNGHLSSEEEADLLLLSEKTGSEKTNGLNGKFGHNCWGGGSHALLMLLRAKAANVAKDDRTVVLNGPKRKNYTWLTRRGVKVKIEDDGDNNSGKSRSTTPVFINGGQTTVNHLVNGDSRQPLSSKSQNTSPSTAKNSGIDSSVEANLRPAEEWDVLKGVSQPSAKHVRLGITGCPVTAFYFSAPYRSSILRKKMLKKAMKACKNHSKNVTKQSPQKGTPVCQSPIKVDVQPSATKKDTSEHTGNNNNNSGGLLIQATKKSPVLQNGTSCPSPPSSSSLSSSEEPAAVVVKSEQITVDTAVGSNAEAPPPPVSASKKMSPSKVPESVDLPSLIASKIRSDVAETLSGPSFLPRAHLLSPCDVEMFECDRIVADRCVVLSNIFRNLSTIPGNDAIMAKCWPMLHIFNRLLQLRRHAGVTPRRPFAAADFLSDDGELLASSEASKPSPQPAPWWYPILGVLQENVFVVLTNLAGEFELSLMPDEIARPLCLNLISWYIGETSETTDPFPDQPDTMLTPQRLALETLCKLTVRPGNVDHLIAGPPFPHLVAALWTALGNLSLAPDQVLRELVVVFLAALSQADPGVARCLALNPMAVVLLVSFLEQSEAQCLHAYNANPAHWSPASLESLNISVDILNRAALILLAMAKIDENRSRFRRFDDRLLHLSMSRVLDRQVQQTLAEVVYELDRGVMAAAAAAATISSNNNNNTSSTAPANSTPAPTMPSPAQTVKQ